MGREDTGDGRRVEDGGTDGRIPGVVPTRPMPALFAGDEGGGMQGKGFARAALSQLLCLLTADWEDCAVDLLSWRTR